MDNFESYVLYISVFAISVFGSWCYSTIKNTRYARYKKILSFLLIVCPVIILQGFRYNVGTDYQSYADLSEGFSQGNATYISWYINEPLFILFSRFSYWLGGDNKYFFFLTDAIAMNSILFLVFSYYKEKVSLPVMYFMYYFLCFPYFLNIERQGLAVVLVWFSIRYILERKPVKFTFCIIIAALFHNTAIVALMLYPVYFIFIQRKWLSLKFVIIIISLLIPILFGMSITYLSKYVPIFSKYTKFINEIEDTRINVNWLYMICLVILLFLFLGVWRKATIVYSYLFFLILWQLSSYLLNYYIEWGFRMAFFFEIGLIYSFAFIFNNIHKKQNRVIINIFLVCSMFFHFTYKFYLRGNGAVFPYQFIF